MKICAIICEFNPFHNGHKYLLEAAKDLSGCDMLLCIMSGSFTQRGDITVLDKATRARHAVLCGADAVIELPVAFTVAPAEVFAKGAIQILKSVPEVHALAFGCENPEANFNKAARILITESEQFKQILNEKLSGGESYIKSYAASFEACGGDGALLSHPNNILGVEYTKAILRTGAEISVVPVKRKGQGFKDKAFGDGFSSAQAIRSNICAEEVKQNVPGCVFKDLKDFTTEKALFGELLRFKLLCSSEENLRRIYGCSEGLENKLLKHYGLPFDKFVKTAAGKRYTESRIKRILLANLIGLYSDDCEKYLSGQLYIKPLAIKKERADAILSALSKSDFPLLLKRKDIKLLTKTAKNCLKSDIFADKIRNFIFKQPTKEFEYAQFI